MATAAATPLASSWEFPAIGTRWRIDTVAPLPAGVAARVDAVIGAFDREWSRFRPDSVVSELADRGGRAPAPPDAAAMLAVYAQLSDATHGAVNPLVGDALARRGYDAEYSLADRGARPTPIRWRDTLTWSDGVLRLHGPAVIDVGALGKGRLVDLVADVLAAASAGPFVVDASGDLAVHGLTERIGLEHPFDPARAIGVWEVADAALCASATTRRTWPGIGGARLHHVLDARTGEPVRTIAATWATAQEAMIADAAATALFFEGGDRFAADHGAQWVRMTTDGRVEWSRGCTAELFP